MVYEHESNPRIIPRFPGWQNVGKGTNPDSSQTAEEDNVALQSDDQENTDKETFAFPSCNALGASYAESKGRLLIIEIQAKFIVSP